MKIKNIAAALVLFTLGGTAHAVSMSYNFFQDGYAEGATVSGMFSAEDLDLNGQIRGFSDLIGGGVFVNEVSSFMMEFSGNSIVPAFTADLDDLFGLVWDFDSILGDGFIGATEGIGVLTPGGIEYLVPNGPIPFPPAGQITGASGGVDTTLSFVKVTPKPTSSVPSGGTTVAMLGLGLSALGLSRRFLRR